MFNNTENFQELTDEQLTQVTGGVGLPSNLGDIVGDTVSAVNGTIPAVSTPTVGVPSASVPATSTVAVANANVQVGGANASVSAVTLI